MRRRIRDIVSGVIRRLPIRPHVGAVEGEVAGMPRPAPVIDIAAVLADGVRRRIGDAHVADFQAPDDLVLQAAEERRRLTAVARFRLAFRDQRFAPLLDFRESLTRRQCRAQSPRDPLRHVIHFNGDIDARSRSRRKLVGRGGGQKAVLQIVFLLRGIELHRAAGAVMVGYHQTLRRNERGGAAAQRDHRTHRKRRQVRQSRRIEIQPRGPQIIADSRNLLRRKHPLPRMRGPGRDDANQSCAAQSATNAVPSLHIENLPQIQPLKAQSHTPLVESVIAG